VDPGDDHERLHSALLDQLRSVSAMSPGDTVKINTAITAVPDLVKQLRLGRFEGPILVDHKPRLLLRFQTTERSPVRDLGKEILLKIYGDQPRGEGPLLTAWYSRGINVPRLHYGFIGECSWIVLEYLTLSPLRLTSRSEVLSTTQELARLATAMHMKIPGLEETLRSLPVLMLPRWDFAATKLHEAGYKIPQRWRTRTREAYESGAPRPLHGDLAASNIARDSHSNLVIYDASALTGSIGFDAARWAARASNNEVSPKDIVANWLAIESTDEQALVHTLLGAECILEAGSREVAGAKSVPGSGTSALDHRSTVDELLALGSELLI
jgi:hypothetical protein